ncbi:MAG: beta-lactamase family protein [Acidimicrobiia bacterium]|nr:beta-lactamase family protein [Acidimicrobiia bacterium]
MLHGSSSRFSTWFALAAVLALVLAGCAGDDGSDGDESNGASTGNDTAVDESTIDDNLESLGATVDEVIDDTLEEFGAPGAVVLITRGDDELVRAVGVGDLDTDEPLTADGEWPLRSITKTFTVTLVLQLVDEGLVDLDDPIGDYLDDVPGDPSVTVRQLADMSSGLPDYTNEVFVEAFVEDPTRWFTIDELIAFVDDEPMQFEPGSERVYTNLNTVLLGELVEAVTEQAFADVLDERLLVPLGLDATVYPSGPDDVDVDVIGYAPGDDGDLEDQPVNFSVFGPAGAMVATVADLAAWGRVLADGSLLDEATQAARLEGAPLDEGPVYDEYALGIGEVAGWWGHTGEGFGFTSLVMHDVDTDTTVVIVMNVSQLSEHVPTTLFRRLVEVLDTTT